jgi:RNA polymerase sigma-70 factor (ECF subfamily)
MLQRSESVTMAFLVLLEQLSPEERAVFLLKEVFDYDHAAIAGMLDLTPANSRQIFHRAKARLAQGRPRFAADTESKRAIVARFVEAFSAGDAQTLASVLREDVGMWSDGGGKVIAARRPVLGRDEVVKFVVGLHRTAQTTGLASRAAFEIAEVNHEPAVLLTVRGVLESVFIFSVEDDQIVAIRVMRNPDKLAFIGRQHGAVH